MIAGLKALQQMKPAMLPVEVDGYSTMKISTGKSS
jgi:hypothetical protein